MNILLVDDDKNILNFMEAALKTIGAECTLCEDGQTALNLIEEHNKDHFQLIILDCLLPKVHGFDVLKTLKSNPRTIHIPIIMISGIYKKRTYQEDLLKNKRANGFLLKPFQTTDLLNEIEKYTGHKAYYSEEPITEEEEAPAPPEKKELPTKGKLSEFPFPEIIRVLIHNNSTSTLKLVRESEKKIILLKEGKFLWALSNMIKHTIEHILFVEGALSLEQYYYFSQKASSKQKNHIKSRNILSTYSEGERKAVLRKQMSRIIIDTFNWYDGYFIIEDQMPALSSMEEIFLSNEEIIKEGISNIHNWEIYKNSFGSLHTKFHYSERQNPEKLKLTFSLDELLILRYIKENLPLAEILKQSSKSDFETLQLLYIYTILGIIKPEHEDFYTSIKEEPEEITTYKVIKHFSSPTTTHTSKPQTTKVETIPKTPGVENFYNKIINEKNPLKVLGISSTDSKESIKKKYTTLIKDYHPDKFHNKLDKASIDKLTKIIEIITHAYKTVIEKYDELSEKKPIEIETSAPVQEDDKALKEQKAAISKNLFIKGRNALLKKDYKTAYSSFRYLNSIDDSNIEYSGYYAVSAYYTGNKTTAFELINKVKNSGASNPDLYYFIANIYIDRKQLDQAKEFYNLALTFDPFHEASQKALDTLSNPDTSKDSSFFKKLFKK